MYFQNNEALKSWEKLNAYNCEDFLSDISVEEQRGTVRKKKPFLYTNKLSKEKYWQESKNKKLLQYNEE